MKSSAYSLLFLINTLCNDKIEIVRVKKLHKMTRREKASQKVCDFQTPNAFQNPKRSLAEGLWFLKPQTLSQTLNAEGLCISKPWTLEPTPKNTWMRRFEV